MDELILGGVQGSIYLDKKERVYRLDYWGFPRPSKFFLALEIAVDHYNELNNSKINWKDIGKTVAVKKLFDELVPSFSDPTKEPYHVTGPLDNLHCTCKGFSYRRACSHCDAVKELYNASDKLETNRVE